MLHHFRIRQEETQVLRGNETQTLASIDYLSTNNSTIRVELARNTFSTETYAYIYCGIIASLFVVALTRSITFYQFCMKASQNLHDVMFNGLVSTKMRFFETNPSGRIMNRFSEDIGRADEALPKSLLDAIQFNLTVLGAIFVTIFTNAKFATVVLILGLMFLLVNKIFSKCSTNIKRLEGISMYLQNQFLPR